jgi:hypothetical protein
VCKLNQRLVWNALPYIGGIVALATGIACAALFIIPKVNDWYANHYGIPELKLIAASGNGELSFFNSGRRDLHIHYVVFEGHDPCHKKIIPVNQTIRRGELLVYNSPDRMKLERDYRPLRDEYVQLCLQCWPVIPDGSKEDRSTVDNWLKHCNYVWYTDNHIELESIRSFVARYGLLKGTAKVECFTINDYKPLTISVPCQALLVQFREKDTDYVEPPADILSEIRDSMPPPLPTHSCTHEDLVFEETRRFSKIWYDTDNQQYVGQPVLPKPKGKGGDKQIKMPSKEPTPAPIQAPAPTTLKQAS